MTKKTGIFILILVAMLIAGSAVLVSKLQFSYSFEDFFPEDDPRTEFYYNYREAFETDNDFFIVAIGNNTGIYDYDFLQKIDSLNSLLQKLPYVQEAIGPTRINEYYRDPFMGQVFTVPLLRWQNPESYSIDSLKISHTPGMVGLFFSEKGKAVAINIKHDQHLSKKKCDELSQSIEETVNQFSFNETHLVGRALGQKLYVQTMLQELLLFISLSLVLTIIFLFIAFRSFWGVAIPVFIVLSTILFTLGFVKILGRELDIIMTVLPTIIFVVGMSDSVHILSKYMQELRNGRDRIEAIKYALKSIRLATFLTSFATAVGFITLVLSNIKPISNFGLHTAFGIMMAYGMTYTVMPAILILAKPKGLYNFAMRADFWGKYLHNWLKWIIRNRIKIAFSVGGVVLLSIYFIAKIPVDNLMLEDLRDTHRLKKDISFLENNFSGSRPFELAIMPDEGVDVFSPTFLQDMDTIGNFLQNHYGVGSMLSLSELIKAANKALNAGQQEYYVIPDDEQDIHQIEKFAKRKELASLTALYYNPDRRILRISGKVPDVGRKHYAQLNSELDEFITKNTESKFEHRITGTAQLIDLNNQFLVENLFWDLLLSIVIIGLMMGLVYRSWKIIFLTIIPNIIPLIIIGGIMGMAGISLKMSTSIIFNIAFGIAVDDTIHFLARVRTYIAEGKSNLYAVKRTFLTTGRAMIVTTLIVSGGFLTLILSDFLGTFYIGFLVCLALIIALLTELLVSPLLIMAFYRKK